MSLLLRRLVLRHPTLRALAESRLGRLARRCMVRPVSGPNDYEEYRVARLRERAHHYKTIQQPGLLSFITTVWNTDVAFMEVLANSVFGQEGGTEFEWFILDNGSDKQETVAYLQELAKHACVRLERAETNLGIVGGMRYCLERAKNRYVLPLDSDDYLYPDCVRIFTWFIKQHDYPPLLYSDEDKLEGEVFRDPYFKPDWDPVLFIHSCYIAHLCAIDRLKALELGVYTDRLAEGCHDWDTFTRFLIAGQHPVHVSEVLYSWRMHQQSTSANIYSKPVVYDSHSQVLNKFIAAAERPERYSLEKSPLFGGTPDWWLRRRQVSAVPLTTILLWSGQGDGPRAAFHSGNYPGHQTIAVPIAAGIRGVRAAAAEAAQQHGLVHLLWDQVAVDGAEWPWEALGLMELFPGTVMVGGRIHSNQHNILAAGCYFGFGRGCDTPDRDRPLSDPGFFAQMWKPHSVSAVSSQHAVVDAVFLTEAIDHLIKQRRSVSVEYLGAWLGAEARRRDLRIVYSPFLTGCALDDWNARVPESERVAFLRTIADLVPETALLSPHLGLDPGNAYRPVSKAARATQIARLGLRHKGPGARRPPAMPAPPTEKPSYAEWLSRTVSIRAARYPLAVSAPKFSMLTTVYERTDAALFAETAACLFDQTLPFHEWVVLAHGPTSPALDAVLTELEARSTFRLVRLPENLGIAGGMRVCLDAATGDYIIPMDADDLLTRDALQVLSAVIERQARPAFLYSDEDILVDGVPVAPYWRPEWDPVLNLASSYIWHLCCIRRDVALDLELYTDAGATWCHDWDTVFRIANAGHRPLHIAEVLYHWRQHPASSTNRPDPESGSRASQRHLLRLHVGRQANPDHYEIQDFPIFRGADEWYILRRPIESPPVAGVALGDDAVLPHGLPFAGRHLCRLEPSTPARSDLQPLRWLLDEVRAPHVLVMSGAVHPVGDDWWWEAVKLFELHPEIALVGGQLVDESDHILRGGDVFDSGGQALCPQGGKTANDPGPFALALKPHCVGAVPTDFFLADTEFLRISLAAFPADARLAGLGLRLGAEAQRRARLVAFSPLIKAVVRGDLIDGSPERLGELGRACLPGLLAEGLAGRNLSSLRFLDNPALFRLG